LRTGSCRFATQSGHLEDNSRQARGTAMALRMVGLGEVTPHGRGMPSISCLPASHGRAGIERSITTARDYRSAGEHFADLAAARVTTASAGAFTSACNLNLTA